MKYSKEDIIKEYNDLKKRLGYPPSSAEFHKNSKIHLRHLGKIYGADAFSKLVIECGDTPRTFSKPKSNLNEILTQWGNLARMLNQIPPASEWEFRNYIPTVGGIKSSHGLKWSDIPKKFLDLYSENEVWKDVIDLITSPQASKAASENIMPEIDAPNSDFLQFIPPIVQELVTLSENDNKGTDFEKKVNQVFKMLGFEVNEYGQGTGRNPDGIALELQNRYAILIDSKARKDKYSIGTEDRKFIEYIDEHSSTLKRDGYPSIYFLVVSSSFASIPQSAINKIKSRNISISFITSKQLLKILSYKIQNPRVFDLRKFRDLLINEGIKSDNEISEFLNK